jgi:hypothetical protein
MGSHGAVLLCLGGLRMTQDLSCFGGSLASGMRSTILPASMCLSTSGSLQSLGAMITSSCSVGSSGTGSVVRHHLLSVSSPSVLAQGSSTSTSTACVAYTCRHEGRGRGRGPSLTVTVGASRGGAIRRPGRAPVAAPDLYGPAGPCVLPEPVIDPDAAHAGCGFQFRD